ncbi:MAG: hypothetical protein K0S14_888 [Thermomicrobiales bacterium]|nr:hypothetical protein [Thermomicrobiales bacterium]
MAEQPQRRGASHIDTFDAQWPQLRGQVRSWWGQFTEADVDTIAGQQDRLVSLLQERYGYTRARAEQEVERRVPAYRDQLDTSGVRQIGETEYAAAHGIAARLTEPAGAVGTTVQETGATAARAVADTAKGVGGSLHATGMDRITGDVTGLIRRYPVPAILIGLGIGLLVGRSLAKPTRTPAEARPDGLLEAPRGADTAFEAIER